MMSRCELLIIGGSAGSLEILLNILPGLTIKLPFAIVIVLHRKSSINSSLAELFASKTNIPVTEVEEKDPILPSRIYVAPADYHLMIEADKTFSLDASEKINFSRPSIDLTFQTAAEAYRDKLVALLLSGANTDGTEGLSQVRQFGGITAVQDPEDARVPLMPQTAIKAMKIDHILKNSNIASFINEL
ncbi:MAG TPA: chemotaxis protein CheB [Sphingobacteriaceae bacterium]